MKTLEKIKLAPKYVQTSNGSTGTVNVCTHP